ncbi:MAG: peptide ABC transporter substrate-binding protein [Alphaproteobacteria bacterium]|nr:peptide ABC transporter substrate-binding protein [Alphaproteobacteria bacterium]
MVRTRLAIALLALLPLSSPAPAQQKDDLIIGVSQFPAALHPDLESHVVQSLILGMTQRPFTAYDPDWKLICMLCTELPDRAKGTAREWTTPDGKPGWAIDYAIDPRAKWGDGTPITTRDVQFVYDVGRNPDAGANNQEMYRTFEKLEVKDERKFTVYTNKRECDYQRLGDFELVPAHLEKPIYQQGAKEYRNRTSYQTQPTNPGLWFGPYVVTKIEPGATIVLERNPNWWGKPAAFRRIIFRVVENTAALEANLLSGAIDYIAGEDGLTLDQALAFEKRNGDRFNVVYKPGLIYEHIDLFLENPLLADVRVRQALLMGIDREAISAKLFEGKQPVAQGGVNPLDVVYDPKAPSYPFDARRAAALLDAAGFKPGADGIRRNAAGQPLSLDLMTTAGNRVRELVETVIQSDLKKIGVDIKIKNEPAQVFFGQTMRERKFNAMGMFAWSSSPKNIPYTTLHSSMIPTAANNWSGQNYTGFKNAEMDTVLERVRVECADDVQAQLWSRIQSLYAEELPVLPLYFRTNSYVLPKQLKGVRPTGHQNPSTLWVEDWRWQ